jgi:hypothetical protein
MGNFVRKIGVLAVLLSPVTVAAPAYAQTCSPNVIQSASNIASQVASDFGQLMAQLQATILTLNLAGGAMSSAVNGTMTTVVQSMNMAADSINRTTSGATRAVATSAAASGFRPSHSVCLALVEGDKVALTEQFAAQRTAARAAAGTNSLTDTANQGVVGRVAGDFANKFLSNGFCDPNPATFPLPAGMTCNNGVPATPARPVNADLQLQAILREDIDPSHPTLGWYELAADRFVEHVLPKPPAIPKGDVLATPPGRAQLVAYQSWAAKAGVVNWIVSSSAAMGAVNNFTNGQQNYGRYSYRRALKEMAKGTFDPTNPFADGKLVQALSASKDTEKANIQLVAYKLGAVQSRLLYEIHNRLEMIAIADAVLLSEQLARNKPSGAILPTGGR